MALHSKAYGVCGVAVAARLAVNQEVRVRLPSDTLAARRTTSRFTRVCSWESQRPPKPPHGVRLLALVLLACECAGSHGSLRNCKTGFNSSAGCLEKLRPRGVLDWHATLRRLRSRFDSWRGRSLGLRLVASFGRSEQNEHFSSLGTQVSCLPSTLKPTGQAAVCKAACSGFDSHRRLLRSELRYRRTSGALALTYRE
jgi:hypothetical protein